MNACQLCGIMISDMHDAVCVLIGQNAQRQVEAASLVHSVVADNNPEGAGANNGC